MIRKIIIDKHHHARAGIGAGKNIIARAINDNLRAGYRATINAQDIRIWEGSFEGHSLIPLPIPESIREYAESWDRPDCRIPVDLLPIEFELDFPEEYHRRPGRNHEEDFEFIRRHGE